MSAAAMPLVLLPGSLCDEELFAHQRARFAVDREVIVGRLDGEESIEGLAAAVLAQAPSTFALAGLSLGGIVAAEMHRQAPERIEALALLDTNLDAPGDAQLEQRRVWTEMVAMGRFADIVDTLVPLSTHRRGELDDVVVRMAMRVGPEAFVRQNTALLDRPDRRPIVDDVAVPVLIVCGREDVVCPVELHEELAGRVLRGSLKVVEGAGHLATLDRPDAVTGSLNGWIDATAVVQRS